MQFPELFSEIERRLGRKERIILAIDGMAASGKTTLAAILSERYACSGCVSIIEMDHFFLRPQQKTPERLSEPGGNIDYQRFSLDVAEPLKTGCAFSYKPFDCSEQALGDPVVINPEKLTVVEGVYSMHPYFSDALYDISVFLQIDTALQQKRLLERNPGLYKRFIEDWLPMEKKYFEHFDIRSKCNYSFVLS